MAGPRLHPQVGDVVRVVLAGARHPENKLTTSDQAPPWSLGIGALMRNLASRGLLANAH